MHSRIAMLERRTHKDVMYLYPHGHYSLVPLSAVHYGRREPLVQCIYSTEHKSPRQLHTLRQILLYSRKDVLVLKPIIKSLGSRDE